MNWNLKKHQPAALAARTEAYLIRQKTKYIMKSKVLLELENIISMR